MKDVLEKAASELFDVKRIIPEMPEPARIFQSIVCSSCGEKVMETRTRDVGGKVVCTPCAEKS
jgi:formylmethanofuran dehydrogenase subunit E